MSTRRSCVFLHEGLGLVSMWRDYPQTLRDAAGCRGLVYSRPGYGCSTRVRLRRAGSRIICTSRAGGAAGAIGRRWASALCWLFGTATAVRWFVVCRALFAERTAGIITPGPAYFVEEITVAGIAAAREAHLAGGLRQGPARHHADPDSLFWAGTTPG